MTGDPLGLERAAGVYEPRWPEHCTPYVRVNVSWCREGAPQLVRGDSTLMLTYLLSDRSGYHQELMTLLLLDSLVS